MGEYYWAAFIFYVRAIGCCEYRTAFAIEMENMQHLHDLQQRKKLAAKGW